MTRTTFRILLVASAAIGVLSSVVDLVFPSIIPEPLAIAQQLYDNSTPSSGFTIALAIINVIGVVASYVGLYRFRLWGPGSGLVFTAAGILVIPFVDPSVSSGWTMAALELSATLWGAVLAIAYFSPLREQLLGSAR
jgi:hypothetical protein